MEGVNFGLLQQLRDIFQPFSELKRGYMEDHPNVEGQFWSLQTALNCSKLSAALKLKHS